MKGQIVYENDTTEVIRSENMILRGCQLRNTAFVEGIVLYAGVFRLEIFANMFWILNLKSKL